LVVALALQSFVENLVSGIVLQSRRPFKVGDTVRLGDFLGNVVDVDSRTVVLQGLDGSWIRIPNSNVANEAIVNLTRSPSRRSSALVGVAYESDLYEATSVLNEALSRVSRVLNDPPPSVVLNEFGNSSITFTLYYWHASDVPSELAARHDVILAVHHALASAGITIAFPQVVVWSGERSDSGPYEHEPAEVYTAHPGLDAAVARRRRTLRPQLKRPGSTKRGGAD
jgi:small-conductance mechanosensitive channel